MAGWLDGWMVGWLDGWMAGWLDGWMAGWLDGWMAEGAPETIDGEECFVHPLNPPETSSHRR